MAIIALVTFPEEKAEEFSKLLLSERVCACVNVLKGVNSFYWWETKLENSCEAILIIKTKEALFPKLKRLILNNHPYSIPEIISLKIDQAHQAYLEWINREANAEPGV